MIFLAPFIFLLATLSFRPTTDSRLNSLQTRALALHGDVDLTRYRLPPEHHNLLEHGASSYSAYGVGVSLVGVPLYWMMLHLGASDHETLEGVVAGVWVAIATVAILLLLVRLFGRPLAVVGAVLFLFGTAMWTIAATAYWQQGPLIALQILGITALLGRSPGAPFLAGAALAGATLVRPTQALFLVALGVLVLTRGWRPAARYAAGALLVLIAIPIQNRWIWGDWLRGGYSQTGFGFEQGIPEAVWGGLFGWWRGLFLYSPVLVVGVIGLVVAARRRDAVGRGLLYLAAPSTALFIVYARFGNRWGGDAQFGNRYLLEVVPTLMLAGIYALARIPRLRIPAAALGVISILTTAAGALPDKRGWDYVSAATTLGDSPIGRAWSAVPDRPLAWFARLAGIALVTYVWMRFSAERAGAQPPTTASQSADY